MAATETVSDPERVQLAARAYVYGYPFEYNLREIVAFVDGAGSWPMQAPYNEFGHNAELVGAETKFVSPNNDTCYSIAACDVRQGPLVLHVPEMAGRYFVLQFIDAWTNNFAYIGRRATGTDEASFLLVERGYEGEVPAGMQVIHAPTGVFVILGRIQVDGVDDLPAVRALQDQLTLTPLSSEVAAAASRPPIGVPQPDSVMDERLEWWERFRVALKAFPPPPADAPFLHICRQFGLTEPDSPYVNLGRDEALVLSAGAKQGQEMIESLMKNVEASPEGWQAARHLFDYNLDFYEVGTIDSPEWRIEDRTKAYVTRAIVARGGMWGNHGYEADYAAIWVDADGEQLDGRRRYELRRPTPPPVDAFWSLTMYDVPEFYLVANPIGRYSIGDRTPGLKTAPDGSITIYLQRESPGPEQESNWLPTPSGGFRPLLRMYQPRPEILDGSYVLPAITRVAN